MPSEHHPSKYMTKCGVWYSPKRLGETEPGNKYVVDVSHFI